MKWVQINRITHHKINIICHWYLRDIVCVTIARNKRQRIPKGQLKMDNPEKLATQGTQDEDKKKTTTQIT